MPPAGKAPFPIHQAPPTILHFADPAQPDAFSPVTTEAEVRALYGDDADLIASIEAYQGDFLVQLGTDDSCPSLDWVYGESGIRRRMLWLDTPLLRCEIESQASVRVVTGGPNIYNGVPSFPRVELATLSLLYDEQGRDRGYDPYVSPGIGSSEIYWAGAGELLSMGDAGPPGGHPLRSGRCRRPHRGLRAPGGR